MTDKQDAVSPFSGKALLDRRSWLKVAAGAVTMGAIGAGTAAADEDYDVIRVPAGDTYRVQLGTGDTLENTVIDISASGARYQINAVGSNWTIRNVGVRGVWDGYDKAEPLIVSVPDAGGSARIENLYLGDGAHDDTYPGATGIFVSPNHAGVLEIDRVNIQGYPDNAIYGSGPGNPSKHSSTGAGGEVHITNSFAADCRAGGFRIGTNGSYVENCVAVGCDRNFWGFYEETEAIDCDFSNARLGDVGTGDGHWGANARARVTDTRFGTTVEHSGQVLGESAGSPQRSEPEAVEGVPLTAEDAASGSSGSSEPPSSGEPDDGDDEDETDDEDDLEGGDEHLLAFVTEPEAQLAGYEFTADGPVEFAEAPYETPSGGSIEGGTFEAEDFVDEDGEGWRAGGVTGGGQGDAFLVDGPITSIDLEQPDVMWVELDGERMDPEEIVDETAGDDTEDDSDEEDEEGNERLLAFVTEPNARLAGYEFTADAPVEFAKADYETPSGGSIEGGTFVAEDFVEEADDGTWRAGGVSGGGQGDAFTVTGPVTSIDIEQPDVMWVELDGERMDPDEILEETAGNENGSNGDSEDEAGNENGGDDSNEALRKAIVIDGTDADEPSTYSFEVSGAVEPSTYRGATIDDDTVVDGGAVEGTVDGTKDAYRFTGDVTGFWLSGDATVDLEYDAR
ncbi:hypothetical protein [Natrarchaeobaculum sulfurireducens]|uniref:Right handed beta helix domain-containing protein n=1 Tax=Natrarchaeobaculum sulfurireducens TaxID=2044521 RepID=A0A346PNX6_9EURY|nr:hypothetical protein [Natrarchaeobaculum sulfurireducens]AXR81221.1 hypothetical protein AArcMg_1205 [Natrarchaeobaculum sulfurireducens]